MDMNSRAEQLSPSVDLIIKQFVVCLHFLRLRLLVLSTSLLVEIKVVKGVLHTHVLELFFHLSLCIILFCFECELSLLVLVLSVDHFMTLRW